MVGRVCATAAIATLATPAGLAAQLPTLPAQSYYAIGRLDWTLPCGPWAVNTELTSTPWDRLPDPGYPGTQTSYACRVGGIFYIRGLQHDATCSGFLPLGMSLPPLFLFGPRTPSFVQINSPLLYPGQNVVFNAQAVAFAPSHYGPWEFNSLIGYWAAQVFVPNDPVFTGTEWEAQAAFWTPATGQAHLGNSRYTRIL